MGDPSVEGQVMEARLTIMMGVQWESYCGWVLVRVVLRQSWVQVV